MKMKNFLLVISLTIFSFNSTLGLIIDHNSAQEFSQYHNDPSFRYYVQLAKDSFVMGYGHTSHGSQITTGMSMVRTEFGDFYDYDRYGRNDVLYYYEGDGYGTGDLDHDVGYYPDWITETSDFLENSENNHFNMIMWSWCGQASQKTESTMSSEYLQPMTDFEEQYPDVTFIYMTGHLDGTGINGNLRQRNDQIRSYVQANNKVLFDFADIERHDLNGVDLPDETDRCNWCSSWCDQHPEDCPSCSSCAHSHCLNCFNKGKAFWVMLARLAGWNPGRTTTTVSPTSTTSTSTRITSTISVDQSPQWFNLRHNPVSVLVGNWVNILVDWWDDQEIQQVIISENSTGSWVDHVVYQEGETTTSRITTITRITTTTRVSTSSIGSTSTISYSTEWTQHAHDAQRTGYISEEPNEPWTFKWHWEPDNMQNMPRGSHPVTGGDYVYMPGGTQGLYAIRKSNGQQAWKKLGAFNAAPAYDPSTGYLYAGDSNGNLYKIKSSDGSISDTYSTGSGINTEILLIGDYIYVTTENGDLHKVNKNNMNKIWKYSGNSKAETTAAYSSSKDLLIFGTADLYVHAIRNSDGGRKWRVKPTSLPADENCGKHEYSYGWPVVADRAGIVFIRMRLGEFDDWLGGSKFPTTNSEIKSRLEGDPNQRPLFALDLDDGQSEFTPAVGGGGVDCWPCGLLVATMGPMPVIKSLPSGKQVAYTIWRNGDTTDENFEWDGRWDSHMGEMVLDDSTVPGYSAGDVRFVNFESWISDGIITDEQCPISMAGNTIFHAHWGQSEAFTITDRSDSKGDRRMSPIETQEKPLVVRRISSGAGEDLTKHTFTGGTNLYCDSRWCQGPGFWVYLDQVDPPTPDCGGNPTGYGDCFRPRYTFVSDGMIYVVGNGGDIFALNHN